MWLVKLQRFSEKEVSEGVTYGQVMPIALSVLGVIAIKKMKATREEKAQKVRRKKKANK